MEGKTAAASAASVPFSHTQRALCAVRHSLKLPDSELLAARQMIHGNIAGGWVQMAQNITLN
eukprot:scaffold1244_cov162-Ochromonas_danica.AAC.21